MLQAFPSSFPPDQVVENERCSRCSVPNCNENNCSRDILDLMKHFPEWVEPHMVYPAASVEKKQILGHGQYGTVHKGIFHHGKAV